MADNKKKLLLAAKKARKKAYAPYSNFHVGAAVLGGNGRIYSGCNVENASFGLTCCAERNAIFAMVAAGERRSARSWSSARARSSCRPAAPAARSSPSSPRRRPWSTCATARAHCRDATVGELVPFIFHLKKGS